MTAEVFDRRRFLVAAGGVAAGAIVAACSGSQRGSPQQRVGSESPRVMAVERARQTAGQRTIETNLRAVSGEIDLGGLRVATWSYGGELPGPQIRLRRGDLLVANLRNDLPDPTTIHWHGLALRNDMDGVPELTQRAIQPGTTFRYEFTVADAGTYIFHSHVGTQLDRGLYGPLIIEDPNEPGNYDSELVVELDDWLDGTGRTPDSVLKELQTSGMGNMGGHGGMDMPRSAVLGGDAGDVQYAHYLVNGRLASAPRVVTVRPGQRVRLRIMNESGDTAFRVGVPGVSMTLTHTDGFPVQRTDAEAVLVGMGERFDAVITVPDRPVPLLAIAEGKNGFAQLVLQSGVGTPPDPAALVGELAARPVRTATELRATPAVTLPDRKPDVTHELKIEGPGNGYRWTINGQVYDPNRGVPVREGQRVRLRFTNSTTMFHPMHLHGHTFQVRSPQGSGARKDTVIVLPRQSLDVDFDANNPGQWLTHCHNVYHQESGMMTVVSYVA